MFASKFRFFNRLIRLRQVEEPHALWLSKQRFNAIWEATADAMVVSDANGIVLAANPAYYHLYGYSPNQVLGHNFAIIFPEDQRETVNVQYTELFQRHTDIPTYESHIRTADGSKRIVEAHA